MEESNERGFFDELEGGLAVRLLIAEVLIKGVCQRGIRTAKASGEGLFHSYKMLKGWSPKDHPDPVGSTPTDQDRSPAKMLQDFL